MSKLKTPQLVFGRRGITTADPDADLVDGEVNEDERENELELPAERKRARIWDEERYEILGEVSRKRGEE